MAQEHYERRQKEDRPVVAICYDFDKTLSPDDMQAQGFIQACQYDVAEFWKESNSLAAKNHMDQNLAYMYMMMDAAQGRVLLTKDTLLECGAKVSLFPGVESWFSRIREYGKQRGVIVEHYIISSGLREMIEGTSVAGEFEEIYASAFYYNDKNVPIWPAQAVNYTSKTQFLFRIEKGVLDISDPSVNDAFTPENIRVPFRNMIYIGDSDTDVPCMKLVNTYGGHSIGVYNREAKDKTKVYKMMREGRIKYYVPADYTEDSELDALVKGIIDRTAANEKLESFYYRCKEETADSDRKTNEEEQEKTNGIIALEESDSFARTHDIIKQLQKYSRWSEEEKEALFRIAIANSQVYYILQDLDVRRFFEKLLKGVKANTKFSNLVKEELENE